MLSLDNVPDKLSNYTKKTSKGGILMNKATGCILLIGLLIVGVALYGMNMVSANQIITNPGVYRNNEAMPARFTLTAPEQGNLNEQGDLKTNRGQETSNVNPAPPLPPNLSYIMGPGTTDGKPDNTRTGNPQQQPPNNNAPLSYYGCWDRDGCW